MDMNPSFWQSLFPKIVCLPSVSTMKIFTSLNWVQLLHMHIHGTCRFIMLWHWSFVLLAALKSMLVGFSCSLGIFNLQKVGQGMSDTAAPESKRVRAWIVFWLWVNLRDWWGSSGILSLSSSLDVLAADRVEHIVAIKKLSMLKLILWILCFWVFCLT